MKHDFRIIRDEAYNWDAQPREHLRFNGRVLRNYGLDYVKMKLSREGIIYDGSIYGQRFDAIQNVYNTLNQEQQTDLLEVKEKVVDMEVPEDKYAAWINSIPEQYFDEYKTRKFLIDQYLNTFSDTDRARIIKIMCENLESMNYVQFLDVDPNTMTTQQYLIYKDIIRYYDKLNLENLLNQGILWDSYNDKKDAMLDQRTPETSIHETIVENDPISERLNHILTDSNEESESLEELRNRIDELNNDAHQAIINSKTILNQVQQPTVDFRTQQDSLMRNKNLTFTQPIINQLADQNKISYVYSNTYGNISRVGYVNNIQDLIAQRNAVAISNNELVNKIIANQINYNLQFAAHSHNISNLQNTTNTIGSIFNQQKSSPIAVQQVSNPNIYKKTMNFNANNQDANMFNSAASPRMNEANDGIVKPLLIKSKPNKQNTQQQSQPFNNSIANKPVVNNQAINMPNRSYTMQQPVQKRTILIGQSSINQNEPSSASKVSLSRVKESSMNNKTSIQPSNEYKTQDIVGVYKVNTKPEEQPLRVYAGIPTKKID